MLKIYLQPIGEIDHELLERVRAAVEPAFDEPVRISTPIPVPESAFSPARRQYHSTAILRLLVNALPDDALRALGVADVDLFVPHMNFVFGEAAVGGKVSVISLCRLHPEFYGDPPNRELFVQRAVTEAVHELGHTFGLRHCSDPRCVMYFSNTIQDTDRKFATFCEGHTARLRQGIRAAA